jgi:hypothetical protein
MTGIRRRRGAWLAVLAIAGSTHASAAQTATGVLLRSVEVTVEGGMTVVTVEADGALPAPTLHSLDGPPRIYFDLTGVSPKSAGTTQVPGTGAVSRARVALNSENPNVTRVVLELRQREPFGISTDERQTGRLLLFIGADAGRGGGVVRAAAATASGARAAGPSSPVVSRSGDGDFEQYRALFSGVLKRLQAQRSVLSAIDAGENVTVGTLRLANSEFGNLGRLLAAAKPTAVVKSAHNLLVISCTLGATATKLRLDASADDDQTARRNAGSAAAGALLLFDQACASLGCSAPQR